MRVELFGLAMETPNATFYLWSPWRCSFLEHKLFDALKGVPGATLEPGPDDSFSACRRGRRSRNADRAPVSNS